jgi:hypothetical protein
MDGLFLICGFVASVCYIGLYVYRCWGKPLKVERDSSAVDDSLENVHLPPYRTPAQVVRLMNKISRKEKIKSLIRWLEKESHNPSSLWELSSSNDPKIYIPDSNMELYLWGVSPLLVHLQVLIKGGHWQTLSRSWKLASIRRRIRKKVSNRREDVLDEVMKLVGE